MAKVTGAKAHAARLKRLASPETAEKVGRALFRAGQHLQSEAQLLITTGAQSGKGHVPSRPGEPPNNDTGVLASNIEAVRVEPLKVEVSSNAPYAAHLEYGTSKMQERPYMRPAVAQNRDKITAFVRSAVKDIVGK